MAGVPEPELPELEPELEPELVKLEPDEFELLEFEPLESEGEVLLDPDVLVSLVPVFVSVFVPVESPLDFFSRESVR